MNAKRGFALTLVLTALVALSVPVAAPASLKHNGVTAGGTIDIPLKGNLSFTGSLGGFNCHESRTTFRASGFFRWILDVFFETAHKTCTLTGGLAGTCTQVSSVHSGSSHVVDFNGTDLTIKGLHLTYTLTGGFLCPKTITFSGNSTVTLDPNLTAIQQFTLSGKLASSVGGEVTVSGTWDPVNASDKGTYGLA